MDLDDLNPAGGLGAISKLPVFLDLAGRKAVLAGNTPGLAWKAELIAAAGADVTVLAPEPSEELAALVARGAPAGSLRLVERVWSPADLDGAAIAVADLETLGEAAAFKAAGDAAGILVNTIDKGATCDFYFGAIVSRSPIMIGATTDGTAPILGQAIRRAIELAVPGWLAPWADFARAIRPEVKRRLAPGVQRRSFWETFTERAMSAPLDDAGRQDVMHAIDRAGMLARSGGGHRHDLVAPATTDALTLADVKRLQSADLIVEEPGATTAQAFYRREATRLVIGQAGRAGEIAEDEIEALATRTIESGRRIVVVRLPRPGSVDLRIAS
ncbi:MAG TPA: bifunctional precorrin-2 dehydrogenase/sirohydrochlorin ferrochelatase [Beijerinckiaceae bacterium]|nr:bifunctional precorrin-2 dehydrogenase/sirohydrochlorin ferrochelatase [Beijerinckiaceae bacterium]